MTVTNTTNANVSIKYISFSICLPINSLTTVSSLSVEFVLKNKLKVKPLRGKINRLSFSTHKQAYDDTGETVPFKIWTYITKF